MKKENREAHFTGDINVRHPMIETNGYFPNKVGKAIDQWLDEESYVSINICKPHECRWLNTRCAPSQIKTNTNF